LTIFNKNIVFLQTSPELSAEPSVAAAIAAHNALSCGTDSPAASRIHFSNERIDTGSWMEINRMDMTSNTNP
jgi:hypothetical protein